MCYVILVKSTFLPKLSLKRNENFLRAVMSIPQNVVFNIINAFISFKQEQYFCIQDFPKSTFLAKPRQSLWDRVVHRIRGYKCKLYHQIHGQSHYYLHSCYIGQYFGKKEKKTRTFYMTWKPVSLFETNGDFDGKIHGSFPDVRPFAVNTGT